MRSYVAPTMNPSRYWAALAAIILTYCHSTVNCTLIYISQVSLNYRDSTSSLSVLKSLKVLELSSLVSSTLHISEPVMFLTEPGSDSPSVLASESDQPIGELLVNRAQLYVSSDQHASAEPPETVVKRSFTVSVPNHVDGQSSVSVAVDPSLTVCHLCTRIAQNYRSTYSVDLSMGAVRIRPVVDGVIAPPLFDDDIIEGSQLTDGSLLLLESGPPVTRGQMVLYYSLSADTEPMSIVCHPNHQVHTTIKSMVESAHLLDCDRYYLQTLDWTGSPNSILYKENESLARSFLSHGDRLLLVKGNPPPKDLISLTVLVRATNSHMSLGGWLAQLVDLQTTTSAAELSDCVLNLSASHSSTVDEFKLQILSTIEDDSYCPPSTSHIRLRGCDSLGTLSKIYKTSNKSLNECKVKDKSVLVAEVLTATEDLRLSPLLSRSI